MQTVSEGQSTLDSKREIPKLSLQIPTKPVIFTNIQGGEGLLRSQVSSKCGASSSGGFLRGLSFKKKTNPPHGEKSRLLNSNQQAVAESPALSRVMWGTRCSSLPGPAFESPRSVATPASARTASENQRSYVGSYFLSLILNFICLSATLPYNFLLTFNVFGLYDQTSPTHVVGYSS